MFERILTARRLRLYPIAVLIGASLGFAIFVGTSRGLDAVRGGRVGGDFPAFYGAARIIRHEGAGSLYDPATQRRAQADLLPERETGWVHFPYPPFVALAYVPFTLVSFKTAYVVHSLLMVGCCVLAVARLRGVLPRIADEFWPVVAAVLTFYPLFRANVGGQNTAVSLLCASAAAVALAKGRPAIAGLWLGAWLFKPQFALPVILAVACAYPRILAGVALTGGAWYLAGAAVAGFDWPLWWIREAVRPFAAADLVVDRGNGVSFLEQAVELGVPFVGWILIALVAILVIAAIPRGRRAPVAFVGLAAAAAVVVSPHALYYDGGLAVLGFAAAGAAIGTRLLSYAAGAWLLAVLQPLRPFLPLSPITIVLIAAMFSTWRAMWIRREAD